MNVIDNISYKVDKNKNELELNSNFIIDTTKNDNKLVYYGKQFLYKMLYYKIKNKTEDNFTIQNLLFKLIFVDNNVKINDYLNNGLYQIKIIFSNKYIFIYNNTFTYDVYLFDDLNKLIMNELKIGNY